MSTSTRPFAVLLGVLFMILAGRLAFSIGIGDLNIPITGQTLAVLLIGYYCRSVEILLIFMIYLGSGSLGAPVFAEGEAGLQHLTGKSGGYLYSFPLGAWLVCRYRSHGGVSLRLLVLFVLATALILLIGMLHLSSHIGIGASYTYGVQPYLAGGFVKCLLALAFIFVVDRFLDWY